MTKKHYKQIAEIIRRNTWENNGYYLVNLEDFMDDLCTMFENDNPNFDRDKFWIACTGG